MLIIRPKSGASAMVCMNPSSSACASSCASRALTTLLATGQQKLEDTSTTFALGKLKDRFPPALRVHLATTNIRDVVHRRLLKKNPADGLP